MRENFILLHHFSITFVFEAINVKLAYHWAMVVANTVSRLEIHPVVCFFNAIDLLTDSIKELYSVFYALFI
jgi:hypothetical protein